LIEPIDRVLLVSDLIIELLHLVPDEGLGIRSAVATYWSSSRCFCKLSRQEADYDAVGKRRRFGPGRHSDPPTAGFRATSVLSFVQISNFGFRIWLRPQAAL
jgi:hypothetical protein